MTVPKFLGANSFLKTAKRHGAVTAPRGLIHQGFTALKGSKIRPDGVWTGPQNQPGIVSLGNHEGYPPGRGTL